MENATKALLIAATVLIVIVLIALGVNLLNAGGDTSQEVEGLSGQISDKTGHKSESILDNLLSMSGSEILICLVDSTTSQVKRTTKISVANGKTWNDIKGKKFNFNVSNRIQRAEIGNNTYDTKKENQKSLVAVKLTGEKIARTTEPFLYKVKNIDIENKCWRGEKDVTITTANVGNAKWTDTISIGSCYVFYLANDVYTDG